MGIDAPKDKVIAAVEMARFVEVLKDLPNGLATNIAEKGVSLSGGQKQRLALARGIFFALDSDSDIILLDESTSSVDVANEQLIYEVLLRRFNNKLILATTHKFNLLPLFDEIIVMQGGRVVEKGSLTELIKTKGELFRMWNTYISSAGGLNCADENLLQDLDKLS
jgi:ABC-type bacteriocin/lantibiotic exporter with double-glycine peptidase domain